MYFIIVGILFFSKSAQAQSSAEQNVTGWAWVGNSDDTNPNGLPHIGWVSLNCFNYYSDSIESRCNDSDYGVTIDPETGDMSGYLWNAISGSASGLGWINLDPDGFPADPQYAARAVPKNEPFAGQISGWARIKSIKEEGEKLGHDDWGWVHLGPKPSDTRPPNSSNTYGVYIDYKDCNGDWCDIEGYAWAGGDQVGAVKEGDGLGWIFFGDADHQLSSYNTVSGEIKGWAWIGNNTDIPDKWTNIGWVSFNCVNKENDCISSDYKVRIDPSGDFTSDSYAWIGSGFDTPKPDDSIGWIDFNPNPFPADPDYPAKVFLNQGDADNDPYQPLENKKYTAGDIVGWARIPMLEDYGKKLGFENWGWVKLHKTKDEPLSGYGLALSFGSEEKLSEGGKIGGRCYDKGGCGDDLYLGLTEKGYAWSGGGQVAIGEEFSNDVGFGWILFDTESLGLGPTYVSPFFAVEGGSIYAKGNIGSDYAFTPPAKSLGSGSFWYNATYMIVSGGTITHFCSAEGGEQAVSCSNDSGYIKPEIDDPFSAPLYKNEYTNALGKIDVDGLVNVINNKNKFGHTVDVYNGDKTPLNILNGSGSNWADEGATLNGKVYHIQGNFTIEIEGGKDLTFNAGNNDYPNGAGLIIVDGDLNINTNTYYAAGSINDIINLPVVAWIVKGNINISKDVKKTVGVYIDVGNENGGGKISTGDSDELLEVSGAMIAKEFDFQRTGFGDFKETRPAEKIINDGRAGANTPPGLVDFSLAFPIIRQAAPVAIE